MGSFIEDFGDVLEKYESKDAVIFVRNGDDGDAEHLTYKTVKETSQHFCKIISKNVQDPNCCFAFLMPHNHYIPALVISLHKLGHCFVCVDENTPLDLFTQLHISWLISFRTQNLVVTENFIESAVLASELILWKSKLKLKAPINFKDVCYVVCTSGTTGANKVVRVQNYCIYSNVKSIKDTLNVTHMDVIYFGTALTFDPSMIELFLALVTGATLLILPRKFHANPNKLFNHLFLKQPIGVSFLQMCPSVFLRFSPQEIDHIFQKSGLKTLCLGGEEFPPTLVNLPRKNDLKVYNLYGITEVSCWASISEIKLDADIVSLGKALADTIMEIRNENEEGIGELFIGSGSRICLVDDEIPPSEPNQVVFRPTGDLVKMQNETYVYVGRKNDMIKRYGARILLSHIENKVSSETSLFNKCVWCEKESKLLLFFVIQDLDFSQKEKILDKLRVKLLHCLPKECYPDFVDVLKVIPTTKNGKVEKRALQKFWQAQTKTNTNALQIFNELLLSYFGFTETKAEATFLEIGANSILLLQFFEEFKSRFGGELSRELLGMLFEKSVEDCRKFVSTISATKAEKRKAQRIDTHDKKPNINKSNNCTFEIVWKYDLKACVDCSCTIIHSNDKQLVAVGSFSHIFAIIESSSGSKIAEAILPDTIEAACCVSACNKYVFVGCFDAAMYCIEIETGEIVWKFMTGDRVKCTPCLCRSFEAIAFGSYDKNVYCINALSGAMIWKTNLKEIINTNPVHNQTGVFIATIAGNCYCLAETDGSVIWKHSTKSSIFGSPCFTAKNSVCWPNVDGTINCFSCRDGELLWTYKAANQVFSSLLHYKNFVIFGCHDSFLYCLGMEDQCVSLKFQTEFDAPILSKSCIFKEDFVVTATTAGSLYVICLGNGEIRGHITLGAQIFSSPSISNDRIFFGCRDNHLYCLRVNEEIDEFL